VGFDVKRAEEDYSRVRRGAWWRDVLAKFAGRSNQLLSYQQVKDALQLGGPIYRGVRQVPVAQIVGSVDRYRDFDEVFMPAQDRTAQRWKNVARAYYQDIDLPPVRLYKVGEAYFVLDGHHRVSVAREQGVAFIDAEVQEVVSRVPVGADVRSEDLRVLHEYRRFLDRTHLDQLRPDQRIRFTIAGGYDRLLEHIAMHRVFMQLEAQREVSEADAVTHWYDAVYVPLIATIREHDALQEFPGRTESDLYLWIVEHLHFLRETAQDVSIDEAVDDYADQFSEKPIKKMVRAFAQAFSDAEPMKLEETKTQQARDRFLQRTRLDVLRPDHAIWCSDDLGYGRLLEHIEHHRYFMGLDFKRDVSEDEAVLHWYDTVYSPIVGTVRENNLLAEFSGQTETDLYLSIIEYLDQLRQTGGQVSVDQAALDFARDYADEFKQHPIRNIVRGVQALFGLTSNPTEETSNTPSSSNTDSTQLPTSNF
jgi:hypothetical protein